MEGILFKWTNYISGWQPRWFVLEGGTLSYYDSQEDSWKGCKGSIKISVCEIQVHSSDFTRVDLTIPGEQYFYLRAINAAERQKWLVALGSAKACLTDNRTKREKEHQENTDALKTKMSELRLYCDLLLQQVNQIKDSEETEEAGENPGTMVKSTCTTFIKTLEECMLIANHTFSSDQATKTPPGSPPVATIKPQKVPAYTWRYQRFSDIRLDGDSGIPTQAFLDSCYAIVPVLDKLGSTVFGPVKMDFTGNIKKIHQKLSSDPGSFPTLQTIVLHEVQTDVARVRNSATEALLWLKRGLKFLKEFLSLVNSGERDIPGALGNAYGRSLRQYHGWVVRGVFALALRAAPSYSSFAAALVSREGDELKEGFNTGMHRDLGVYLPAMEKQLAILDALYEEYNLESDEVV
uniref:Pleckstrin homology domain-containing family A member 8 n=1 Tax=Salmo trutta TaxID=8032 RepID=A0A674CED2_SALTR